MYRRGAGFGFGLREQESPTGPIQSSGFWVLDSEFWLQGSGFRVPGSGFRDEGVFGPKER